MASTCLIYPFTLTSVPEKTHQSRLQQNVDLIAPTRQQLPWKRTTVRSNTVLAFKLETKWSSTGMCCFLRSDRNMCSVSREDPVCLFNLRILLAVVIERWILWLQSFQYNVRFFLCKADKHSLQRLVKVFGNVTGRKDFFPPGNTGVRTEKNIVYSNVVMLKM